MSQPTEDIDWPRRNLARFIALHVAAIALSLFALIAVGTATHLIVFYSGTDNAGVVIGTETHNVGYEFRGVTGWFVNGD